MKLESAMCSQREEPSKSSFTKKENFKADFRKYSLILLAVLSSLFVSIEDAKGQVKNADFLKEKPDSSLEDEFLKQKEFLINWYKNRVIQDNKFNKKFNEEKEVILKRLEDVDISTTDSLSGWRNDTIFINPKDFQLPEKKSSMTHNLAHDALQANYSEVNKEFKSSMPDWMKEIILQAIKKVGDKGLEPIPGKKESYQTPEEVYARICALRQRCNLQPNQKISRKFLKKILIDNNHDENIDALVMTIPNIGNLLHLINNLP